MDTSTAYRYVAVCDILGFKRLLFNHTLDALLWHYNALLGSIHLRFKGSLHRFPDLGDDATLFGHAVFSDTILVWSHPIEFEERVLQLGTRSVFLDVCTSIISSGIHFGLPIRLGISFGEVAISPLSGLYVGRPIAEAAVLEASQNWIGGACHKSCELDPQFSELRRWGDVFDYEVPTKDGYRNLPAIDWVRWMPSALRRRLRSQEETSPESDRQKYKETFEFIKLVRQRLADERKGVRRMGFHRRQSPS